MRTFAVIGFAVVAASGNVHDERSQATSAVMLQRALFSPSFWLSSSLHGMLLISAVLCARHGPSCSGTFTTSLRSHFSCHERRPFFVSLHPPFFLPLSSLATHLHTTDQQMPLSLSIIPRTKVFLPTSLTISRLSLTIPWPYP